MELLICDDHSCDFSEQELRDWIREHAPETLNRVRICQKEHCVGPAAVAQSALEQAQGEFFICCTAAEVFPEPGALLKGSLQMDDDCAALCQLRRNGQSILLPDMAHLQEGQHLKTIFQVEAVLWRTEEFKSVGGYQTRYQYLREEPALLCALAGGFRPGKGLLRSRNSCGWISGSGKRKGQRCCAKLRCPGCKKSAREELCGRGNC